VYDGIEMEKGVQFLDDAGDGRGAQRAQDCVSEFWNKMLASARAV
jgi:hypothetical protein